jgi:DHA3 family macrolide efflux protein-like MFS transporter
MSERGSVVLERVGPMPQIPTRWFGRFFAIWTGQAFSLFGSQLVQFALVWYLTIETGSATVLAIATMAAMAPQIILSPIAGAYIDRWKRRIVMIVADGLVALSTLILVVLFALGVVEIWQIFMIMFVRSCFTAFHWPASQAATTMLVPEKHLTRVAGFNQSLMGLASILAPPLGAVLIAFLLMQWILSLDIATAVIAILPLLVIRFAEPIMKPGFRQGIVDDMKEGLRFLKGWRGAMMVITIFMILNMLLTPAFSLIPILVLDHFHGGALDFASLEVMGGIGMLVGGIALGIWGGTKRRIVTVMASTTLAGVAIALIAFVPSNGIIIAMGLLLFVGVMMPILNGSVMALMQACVPIGMQGRVFALLGAIAMAATPIGLAIGGPIADLVGILPWFLISGIPMALIGAISFLIPSIMNIENPRNRPVEEIPGSGSTSRDTD